MSIEQRAREKARAMYPADKVAIKDKARVELTGDGGAWVHAMIRVDLQEFFDAAVLAHALQNTSVSDQYKLLDKLRENPGMSDRERFEFLQKLREDARQKQQADTPVAPPGEHGDNPGLNDDLDDLPYFGRAR
jgi:hypothetical protein